VESSCKFGIEPSGCWWESQREEGHWEDQEVGGWIILGWIVEVGWSDVDWISLAQDRDKWRVLVNTVLNLRDVGGKARGKEATRKTKT
jgi:hypothetical protein